VGVGFDGRGNSVTFGVVQRGPFFGSRYGDMKSAGLIAPLSQERHVGLRVGVSQAVMGAHSVAASAARPKKGPPASGLVVYLR
jgi:hypothetical protein